MHGTPACLLRVRIPLPFHVMKPNRCDHCTTTSSSATKRIDLRCVSSSACQSLHALSNRPDERPHLTIVPLSARRAIDGYIAVELSSLVFRRVAALYRRQKITIAHLRLSTSNKASHNRATRASREYTSNAMHNIYTGTEEYNNNNLSSRQRGNRTQV